MSGPLADDEIDIGKLNVSPRSDMIQETGEFSIGIDSEGIFENLLVSPEADSDFTYLDVEDSFTVWTRLAVTRKSLERVDSKILYLYVVLDIAAAQPATLQGLDVGEVASASLEIAGMLSPLSQLSQGHDSVILPRLVTPRSVWH